MGGGIAVAIGRGTDEHRKILVLEVAGHSGKARQIPTLVAAHSAGSGSAGSRCRALTTELCRESLGSHQGLCRKRVQALLASITVCEGFLDFD